jgi:N-acetylneuraminic acid mutarotase
VATETSNPRIVPWSTRKLENNLLTGQLAFETVAKQKSCVLLAFISLKSLRDSKYLSSNMENEQQRTVASAPASGGFTFSVNKPILQTKTPPGRGGSTGVFANGKLVVFGGHFFSGDDKFEYLNETWLLDVDNLVWHQVSCSGELPGPRYGHTAHVLGSRMFVFGGKGPGDTVYKDVYFLDLIEWVWVPVNVISEMPQPR